MELRFERSLRNELGELPLVAREFDGHLRAAGVEEALRYAVDLALEELVGNTIRYGYEDRGQHEIRVQLEITPEAVRVMLEDDARPFDPTSVPEALPASSLAEAPPGGRGIRMVRGLIHDMRYQRASGRNRLALVLPRRR